MTQKSVVVDLGSSSVGAGPGDQRAPARVERRLRSAGRDPVLETIRRDWGLRTLRHEEEPGHTLVAKIRETLGIAGPPDELDVHVCTVRSECFSGITAW